MYHKTIHFENLKTLICFLNNNGDAFPSIIQYYNHMLANSYRPLISKPTRITSTSATLIDHIWVNDISSADHSNVKYGIIVSDLSDHLPIYLIRKNVPYPQGYTKVKFRVFSEENINNFKTEIAAHSDTLYRILCNDDDCCLNDKVNLYFSEYKKIYDAHFPLKNKKIHNKTLSKPWISNDLQRMLKKKNNLYYKKLKNPTSVNIEKYKLYKKELDVTLKLSKKLYFERKIVETSKNMRERWDTIRLLINRQRNNTSACPVSPNLLGQHFSTIADKLNSKLPKTNFEVLNQSNYNNNIHFSFVGVSADIIYDTIRKLDCNKGPGPDEISAKLLKETALVIAPHLSLIFNECVNQGIYPNIFKISKCTPIFKGGDLDPMDPISYRPISILNAVNKIFERIIHDQLSDHLDNNNILPPFQFGYRKKHNTSQAVLMFAKEVENILDRDESAVAVFMDLSKAFDTVDKNILNQKLKSIGVNDNSCKLIYDYMSNRRMKFDNDDKIYNLNYGVPQGSILGPLLFLIYIYDMKSISEQTTAIVYADDTTLIFTGNTVDKAIQNANGILVDYIDYFNMNKLSLNESKTKYMIFTKRKYSSCPTILTINDTVIERVNNIKFLGVVLNDRLNWQDHKLYIRAKISKNIGILNKCRKILKLNDLIPLYNSFILPYLNYCLPLWGNEHCPENDIIKKYKIK